MPALSKSELWRRPAGAPSVAQPGAGAPQTTPQEVRGRERVRFEIGGGAQTPVSRPFAPPAMQAQHQTGHPRIELADAFRNSPQAAHLARDLGQEVPLALRRALTLDQPGARLDAQDVLMFRGAAAASYASLSLREGRDRQGWVDGAKEQMTVLRNELNQFGKTRAAADSRVLDSIERQIEFELRLPPGGLPREVKGKGVGTSLLDNENLELEKRKERMLAFVEGSIFSLTTTTPPNHQPREGCVALPTALDHARSLSADARTVAATPGMRPHLVMDERSVQLVQGLQADLDRRGYDAAQEFSRLGVPTLAASLHGRGLDEALAKALAVSAGKSGASPLEGGPSRDVTLALQGDALLVTHQARFEAELGLQEDPKWAQYKTAAKALVAEPTAEHVEEFIVSVATIGELDLERVASLGWGPRSIIGAAFSGRGTAIENMEGRELASAFVPDQAFEAERTHLIEPQTFLLPSMSPKEQPKLIQIAPGGEMVRVASFVHGEPKLIFQGTTLDAAKAGAVNDRIAAWMKTMSSALSTPHALDEAHALGLVSARPDWMKPKTPHLVDPRWQTPEVEIIRFKDPVRLDELPRMKSHRPEMAAMAIERRRDFGGVL